MTTTPASIAVTKETAAHVARLVAEAPPLTDEQIDTIRAILRPALERMAADAARQGEL